MASAATGSIVLDPESGFPAEAIVDPVLLLPQFRTLDLDTCSGLSPLPFPSFSPAYRMSNVREFSLRHSYWDIDAAEGVLKNAKAEVLVLHLYSWFYEEEGTMLRVKLRPEMVGLVVLRL